MLARDVMTSGVVPVNSNSSLAQAVELMVKLKVSGLPVVDDRGQLVGMLTEGDLLRRAELGTERKRARWLEFLRGPGAIAADYVKTHARRVDEVMTEGAYSVAEPTPLADVVSLMNSRRIKRVPVVRDGAPVGIISRADLVRALGVMIQGAADQPKRDDANIKASIVETLNRQKWAANSPISVQVHEGNVEIRGVLTDDRQRAAIVVAVENTPGVKAVTDNLALVEPFAGSLY
jgi:CBS domain-containing protein